MNELLADSELVDLIKSVFSLKPSDRRLGILLDIPRENSSDNKDWRKRRELAVQWTAALQRNLDALSFEAVTLLAYPDVGSNNADLPQWAAIAPVDRVLDTVGELESLQKVPFESVFSQYQLFLAPTEFSTTAPLKNAAKHFPIRAATMPGFSAEMLPALRIDYQEVNRRCQLLKELVDAAHGASVRFKVDAESDYSMFFDLRFRTAHVSSGRFPQPGVAGNLPSGETYIVPYEGEADVPSQTAGLLPAQIDDSLLVYTIKENRAISVAGVGPALQKEKDHLARVPAYGNMAELGFGVLADFGLSPINEILLDEKLGFHVAFGRSDHFGGQVAPGHFPSPADVIHLDRIYIPSTQPRIVVSQLLFHYADNRSQEIIRDGHYTIFT